MTNKVTILGTSYCLGMILPFGSTGGLPGFGEILQIIIVCERPVFVLKLLSGWYNEHLRSFRVEPTGETDILLSLALKNAYPMAAYNTEDRRLVSLKHLICTSEYILCIYSFYISCTGNCMRNCFLVSISNVSCIYTHQA